MSFFTLPPDSRTLVSKWNTKLALIWKEDFRPLGNSPDLLLLSPGKTPLTITVTKFLDTSVCGGSWWLDPSLSPFLVKFTKILESILLDNPHNAAVLSVGCAYFSSTLFPSIQLSVNMLGYSTLWTVSFLWAKIITIKKPKTSITSVCVHWIYLIHEFHSLSWITEINELFHDILIYCDAPVLCNVHTVLMIQFVSQMLYPIEHVKLMYSLGLILRWKLRLP